ncbi:MAG TPA: DNA-directed RNA polymerase subunit H [archaeon]|nr:DNA-directed RNA polymerase subunit H [archaeon]
MKRLDEHFLVPRHDILTKDEAEGFLKELGVIKKNLPAILEDDPIAEELKAQPGDIIRIVRKSHTAGQAIYYRVVV